MAREQSTTRLTTIGGRAPLLVQANALHIPLADQSVNMICTSPPYWGLRDYSTGAWEGGNSACDHLQPRNAKRDSPGGFHNSRNDRSATSQPNLQGWWACFRHVCGKCGARRQDQQLGCEAMHDCNGAFTGQSCGACWVCHMRAVFAECYRVLRNDGTLWLNCGDSYNAAGRNGHGTRIGDKQRTNRASAMGQDTYRPTVPTLKGKNLLGMPWRLALALQNDGWILRSDIIWAKKNCMPESVTDRPTRSHEYVFMFSKRERYFWDGEAVREPGSENIPWVASSNGGAKQAILGHNNGGLLGKPAGETGRNLRSVWTLSTEPTPHAHFATMPSALVAKCILAGSSEYGVCSVCSAPWRRVVERITGDAPPSYNGSSFTHGKTHDARAPLAAVGQQQRTISQHTTGWEPSCAHNAPVTPAIVFDPFCGSGTTLLTARALGRHGLGTDLSLSYLREIARERLGLTALARWEGHQAVAPTITYSDLPLFAVPKPSPLSAAIDRAEQAIDVQWGVFPEATLQALVEFMAANWGMWPQEDCKAFIGYLGRHGGAVFRHTVLALAKQHSAREG